MMPSIKKAFDLISDDIVELSNHNVAIGIRIRSNHDERLQESKVRFFQMIDVEKGWINRRQDWENSYSVELKSESI